MTGTFQPRKAAVQRLAAAAGSLVFAWLYFLHYLPPFKRFSVPYDLPGYFFSLHDYAFRSLKSGCIPEWDPYMYAGLSFAGNVQASLFYPPLWAAFLAAAGKDRLPYLAVEIVVFLHVWLAWLFSFMWLRGRGLRAEAAMLGAAAFSFCGYMMIHLQHFGIACGMAWAPLALWGIDEASARADWRPLWKTAAGGALVFLAGYPPFFVVFAVCAFVYGLRNLRLAAWTVSALLLGLALAAAQLLPALESTALMEREARYGSGEFTAAWLLSMILPAYLDFSMTAPVKTGDYYYIGAAAILGIVLLIPHLRSRWRRALPAFFVLGVSLVLFTNPWNLVWRAVEPWPLLSHTLRAWYFTGGIMLGLAVLAAEGLDAAMERFARPPGTAGAAAAFAMAGVTLALLWMFKGSNQLGALAGWRGALAVVAVGAAILLLLRLASCSRGARRAAAVVLLVLVAGSDYRIHGTAKWFNASKDDQEQMIRPPSPPGMIPEVMQRLKADPSVRVATDEFGPTAPTLRFWRLAAIQGFDPFVSKQYKEFLADCVRFESNWLFYPDPGCEEKLRWLGVRYYITTEKADAFREMTARPAWRRLSPEADFYQVFELKDVRAPVHFLGKGQAELVDWQPGRRTVEVQADSAGTVVLAESYHPGWLARIGDAAVECRRHAGAFLEISVPPGRRRIVFEFRSRGLRAGAVISAVSLALLAGLLLLRKKPASPAA